MVTLEQKLEAVLFYVGGPLAKEELASILEVDKVHIETAAVALANNLAGRGVELLMVEGEYELVTSPETSDVVARMRKQETTKELGKASSETLAVILYRGPVSRAELEEVRGVNCSHALRELAIRGLILRIEGKTNKPPVKYSATPLLLEHLGVTQVSELPGYTAVCDEIEHFEARTDEDYVPTGGGDDVEDEEEIETRAMELRAALEKTPEEEAEAIADAVTIEQESSVAQEDALGYSKEHVEDGVAEESVVKGGQSVVVQQNEAMPVHTSDVKGFSVVSPEPEKETVGESPDLAVRAAGSVRYEEKVEQQEKGAIGAAQEQGTQTEEVVKVSEESKKNASMRDVVHARLRALEQTDGQQHPVEDTVLEQSTAPSPVPATEGSAEERKDTSTPMAQLSTTLPRHAQQKQQQDYV
jgi:segregation and condensation protein B